MLKRRPTSVGMSRSPILRNAERGLILVLVFLGAAACSKEDVLNSARESLKSMCQNAKECTVVKDVPGEER